MIMIRRGVIGTVAATVVGVGLFGCSGHSAPPITSTVPTPTTVASTAKIVSPPVRRPTVRATKPAPAPKPAPKPAPNDHQLPSGAARNVVSIPALKEIAPIDEPCVVANGKISPPSTDPRRTCLWAGGAPLSAAKGTAMILGHINYSGVDGALGRIGSLHTGDRVYVWSASGVRSTWQVTVIHQRAKADGVDPGAEIGASGPPRLVLVTCGGALLGRHYADLIWVYAKPY
jgi:sortase family protein